MKKVDINVDIGEGFPFDEELLDFATSANVCCGEHAGSWELTKDTIFLCQRKGVRIGMHPGFPDRQSMGRDRLQHDEVDQYANSIFEQVLRFGEYTDEAQYVKPHGAWYNMLVDVHPPDGALFTACRLMLDGVIGTTDLPIMLLKASRMAATITAEGDLVLEEGFADRAYNADGTLVSRSLPGAVLEDPEMVRKQVLWLAPVIDTICIHGDTPDCLSFAELVCRTLEDDGFEVGY
jgi:UPF0271 protein